VTNPTASQTFGVCSLAYYHAAIDELAQTIKAPYFFVFSDDIPWAQQNLALAYPVTYVSHNGAERDYEDLRLMSQCKHHIIANSTFSWWGAWLGAHPGKIVIGPRQWFRNADYDTPDLLPASWLRL